jgi:hypothetical protein
VLDNPGARLGERIGPGRLVAGHRQPVHRAESADEVDVAQVEPPEGEVVEVDPVDRVRMTRQIRIPGAGPLLGGEPAP